SCRAVLTDFRQDRSSPDCRMDFGRQPQRSVSTSDAQIHLEPGAARSLIDARTNGFCRAAVSAAGLLGLASHRDALQFSIASARSWCTKHRQRAAFIAASKRNHCLQGSSEGTARTERRALPPRHPRWKTTDTLSALGSRHCLQAIAPSYNLMA